MGDDTADFGDFVSNEDEELDLEEVVEPWYNYDIKETPHVFYPICLGEGSGSTVWMAHNLQEKRDVALKVMASGEWADNEICIQNEIIQNVQDTSHLVTYLATFLLPGNECHHRVLVFPLMGPCINPLILRDMPMATRMYAARQLLEALESLHKAGIVHRGMAPLHSLNRSAKYKTHGRPLRQIIPHVDLWKQGELVRPVEIPDNLRTEYFYLSDFGLAIKLGDPTIPRGYPPTLFCPPERLHKKHPSFACDMWSYMVIFEVLYLGFPPFLSWRSLIKRLGALPEQWKGLYSQSGGLDSWYDQSQSPDPDDNLASTIADYRPDADPIEREHVLSIMSKVFTYCPEKRPTATQLLQDPSFRAIMDTYGC
ncbi:kinase-like protein [Aspergillus transmontanensis]|uniref:Kinase-like protein n=1 Tax=Aspergillus transmontanensis TaxID=1034304 RepID=A0A5N6VWB7_9EURO|nr:kinase-like protein [Aspergillus transmontanensis]